MIDRRKHYILVLDTETANTLTYTDDNGKQKMDMSNVLVYDCGFAVVDTHGVVYETHSYVNRDIFHAERDLMQSAYYAWKIPRYEKEIAEGSRKVATTYEIRAAMLDVIERYGIKEVAAYNARFDDNALKVTERYCTGSKYRYWFPFGMVDYWDIMRMAQDVICSQNSYKEWCKKRGYVLPNGVPRKTAEIVYRYISGQEDFEENHTGLEDVLIETAIMAHCFRQHKPMRKLLYENSMEFPPMSDFQKALWRSIKEQPTINRG